ncbi:hypothetical protein ONZ45_g2283 [Pleurotus djamor]|nr:hypothetical protein ONZ45_g2283 [Pleurotus djamor]
MNRITCSEILYSTGQRFCPDGLLPPSLRAPVYASDPNREDELLRAPSPPVQDNSALCKRPVLSVGNDGIQAIRGRVEDLNGSDSHSSASSDLQSRSDQEDYQVTFRQKLHLDGFKVFNPNAAKANPQALKYSSTPSAMPIWYSMFDEATKDSSKDIARMKQDVKKIVNSFAWNTKTVPALATHLCWTGSNCNGNVHTLFLARFAVYLYEELRNCSTDTARGFLQHLRVCCLVTFESFWDLSMPLALSFQTANPSYIRAAQSLTKFIGDLFACSLLSGSHALQCLIKVMENTISMDHLEALDGLLLHAGKDIWYYQACSRTPHEGTVTRLAVKGVEVSMVSFVCGLLERVAKMGQVEDFPAGSKEVGNNGLRLPMREEVLDFLQKFIDQLDSWVEPEHAVSKALELIRTSR